MVVAAVVAAGALTVSTQAQERFNNGSNQFLEQNDQNDVLTNIEGQEGGSETEQEDDFSGVQFNDPPKFVKAGDQETFEATAQVDQSLEGATLSVSTPEGYSDSGEVSASCDEASECTVEKSLSFPDTGAEGGYSADVEVQFNTDSDTPETRTAQTAVQVVGVSIAPPGNQELSAEGEFVAGARAPEDILTEGRIRWTTEADVDPSESTAIERTCRTGEGEPRNGCAIDMENPLDLPSGLSSGDKVDVIAEFDVRQEGEQRQLTDTKTVVIESGPGLDVKVTNSNSNDPVSGARVYAPEQDLEATTGENGEAILTDINDDTINQLEVECSAIDSTTNGPSDIDPTQTDSIEIPVFVGDTTTCQD